jgi:enamine deaminase RidA (YjgF/YER057c/UK114 family)
LLLVPGKRLFPRGIAAGLARESSLPDSNEIYARHFGDHRPARTVVPVARLHYGYLVEMDVIGALRGS